MSCKFERAILDGRIKKQGCHDWWDNGLEELDWWDNGLEVGKGKLYCCHMAMFQIFSR